MKKEDVLSVDIVGCEDNVDIFELEKEVDGVVCEDNEDPEIVSKL